MIRNIGYPLDQLQGKVYYFLHEDQLVTLQGERNPMIEQAQFHQFKRVQTTNAILALYILQIQQQYETSLFQMDLEAQVEP